MGSTGMCSVQLSQYVSSNCAHVYMLNSPGLEISLEPSPAFLGFRSGRDCPCLVHLLGRQFTCGDGPCLLSGICSGDDSLISPSAIVGLDDRREANKAVCQDCRHTRESRAFRLNSV